MRFVVVPGNSTEAYTASRVVPIILSLSLSTTLNPVNFARLLYLPFLYSRKYHFSQFRIFTKFSTHIKIKKKLTIISTNRFYFLQINFEIIKKQLEKWRIKCTRVYTREFAKNYIYYYQMAIHYSLIHELLHWPTANSGPAAIFNSAAPPPPPSYYSGGWLLRATSNGINKYTHTRADQFTTPDFKATLEFQNSQKKKNWKIQ